MRENKRMRDYLPLNDVPVANPRGIEKRQLIVLGHRNHVFNLFKVYRLLKLYMHVVFFSQEMFIHINTLSAKA